MAIGPSSSKHSFTANFSIFRTMVPFAKNSLPNGLELLIDAESYDYAISSTGSEGIIMSILYQLDIPIMKNIGINLQPGTLLSHLTICSL